MLRLGTQRALEIISEACRHIPDELLNLAPDVPWKKIRGIGNVLRHEYHKIADDVIWVVVTENILPLKAAIKTIKQSIGNESQP
ncbi:HepT-like ribonuclease domain-containing protein [Neorhizobium galegae]|uniref:HepT-like ribonuclease domain-containing protein n=1 Tax=Neorhizobium galegae TaxID=399 RepID=UPI00351E8049